jgi:hypothetical protein
MDDDVQDVDVYTWMLPSEIVGAKPHRSRWKMSEDEAKAYPGAKRIDDTRERRRVGGNPVRLSAAHLQQAPRHVPANDNDYATRYGCASCQWLGSIAEVAIARDGAYVCPRCGGFVGIVVVPPRGV